MERGRSKRRTASTFSESGLIPFAEMWWERYSSSRAPKIHLLTLSTRVQRLELKMAGVRRPLKPRRPQWEFRRGRKLRLPSRPCLPLP